MPKDNLLEKKEKFFNEFSSLLGEERSNLTENTFLNDLELDSMAVISTIALIDEIFDIVISGDDLMKCSTIFDIFALLEP